MKKLQLCWMQALCAAGWLTACGGGGGNHASLEIGQEFRASRPVAAQSSGEADNSPVGQQTVWQKSPSLQQASESNAQTVPSSDTGKAQEQQSSPSQQTGQQDSGGTPPSDTGEAQGQQSSPSQPTGQQDSGGVPPSDTGKAQGQQSSPSQQADQQDSGGTPPSDTGEAPGQQSSPSQQAGQQDSGGTPPSDTGKAQGQQTEEEEQTLQQAQLPNVVQNISPCVPSFGVPCLRAAPTYVEGQNLGPSSTHLSQHGLSVVKAPQARNGIRSEFEENALPGSGITVGFYDTGVEARHPVFGQTEIRQFYWSKSIDANTNFYTSAHGTSTASALVFTAPGVGIESYAAPAFSDYGEFSTKAKDLRLSAHLNFALGRDIDVLNIAKAPFGGNIEFISEAQIRQHLSETIASLAQADTAAQDRILVVWAAGNQHGRPCDESSATYQHCVEEKVIASSVSTSAGLMAHIEQLQGHLVAVVAVESNPQHAGNPRIASWSSRCGIAKDHCIAAWGGNTYFATFNVDIEDQVYGYREGSGTSIAAPIVSGGLALLMHRFRDQVPSVDVLQRLFETANDEGIYGDANIYGHGLMDLEAAIKPVGGSSIAGGSAIEGPSASLHSTRLSFGPAFGAGAMRSLAGREIVVFDSLGAPFWRDLGSLVSMPSQNVGIRLRRMLQEERDTGSEVGLWRPVTLASSARLSLAAINSGYSGIGGPAFAVSLDDPDSQLVVSAFTTEGRENQPPTSGLSFVWEPLGLRAGMITERESVLGVRAEGGFGRLSAASAFTGLDRGYSVGFWTFDGSVEFGVTDPSAGRGMLAEMDTALATKFELGVSRETDSAGWIRVALEQPLRIEYAPTLLWVPVGRTKAGQVLRERWHTDLAPSGRQVDLSARWSGRISGSGRLLLGAVVSRHPGHDRLAKPSLSLLAGYRLAF